MFPLLGKYVFITATKFLQVPIWGSTGGKISLHYLEAVVWGCSVEEMFLEISQNS